jgi:hypothetical protein
MDTSPSQEDASRLENEAEFSVVADIASYYVDRASIHVQPFTLHLILGANSPDGDGIPQAHLIMSPHFAAFLRDALTEAIATYQTASAEAAQTDGRVME